MKHILGVLLLNWKSLVIIFTPIIFSAIPITYPIPEAKCGYVIIVMAVYWMTEVLPLGITALIPVFAFPLLGVLSTKEVCIVYMKDTNMMFVGGLAVAVAVEHCQLHKRISLITILVIGQSPRRLMFGFMITTMFLSMWISNTATTAMMMPILKAVLDEIENQESNITGIENTEGKFGDSINDLSIHRSLHDLVNRDTNAVVTGEVTGRDGKSRESTVSSKNQNLRDMYYLAVAYASNIGGTGSITGTGPNIVVKDFLETNFSEETGLNFASWMLFNVPGMIICVLLAWIWLQILFIYIKKSSLKMTKEKEQVIKKMIQERYKNIGPISQHEITVLVLFISLVLLWFSKSPEIMPGWGDLFETKIKDATPAIFITFLLFVLPKNYASLWSTDSKINRERCLSWKVLEAELPWGIILLLGGGFAMAKASKASNLSVFLGSQLTLLKVLPPPAIVLVVSIMTAMVTEVASNTATASIVIPILNELATSLKLNPLYLMLPAAISCSFAFMLPVATPPNAIVFENADMKNTTMMSAGFVMNILCVLMINVIINTYGILIFDVMEPPSWINSTVIDP